MNPGKIEKPIIIIGCPRSGTSLLFSVLRHGHGLASLYNESHGIFDRFYQRQWSQGRQYNNDSLSDEDLTADDKALLMDDFYRYSAFAYPNYRIAHQSEQYKTSHHLLWKRWIDCRFLYERGITKFLKIRRRRQIRLVEKTPRNCFRMPFLNQLFPDAQYIFLKRDGKATIASLIEGWIRVNPYMRPPGNPTVTIPLNIKGIAEQKWHFVLPPGWEDYVAKPVEQVAAFQWLSVNRAAIDGLAQIDSRRVYSVCYEDLIDDTETTLKKLCEFIQIPYTGKIKTYGQELPIVPTVHGDAPRQDKWRQHEALIQSIYPQIVPMMQELGYDPDDFNRA